MAQLGGLVLGCLVGPSKFKARKFILFTESSPKVEIKNNLLSRYMRVYYDVHYHNVQNISTKVNKLPKATLAHI